MASSLNDLLGPGSEIEARDLYPKLKGLEKRGLVRSVREEGEHDLRRRVYYPYENAPGAVMDWMSATAPLAVVRAEFYIKLAVARKEHLPALREVLNVLERCVKAEIDEIPDELGPLETLSDLRLRLVRGTKLEHLRVELNGIVKARRGLHEFL